MRCIVDIMREIPFKTLKKSCIKKGRHFGINLGDEIKVLYSDLLKETADRDSELVLLVYPYIDEALYADGAEHYDSSSVVVLYLSELEELCDSYGLQSYLAQMDSDIRRIEYFLKNPEEINDENMSEIRKHSTALPTENFLEDFAWCQLPGLKVYGHDSRSKKDLELVSTFLTCLASLADSKEEFEEPDIEDELFDMLLNDGKENNEETDEDSGVSQSEEALDVSDNSKETDEEEEDKELFDVLMDAMDEEEEHIGIVTPEQKKRYRIAEITNFKQQYEAVRKLMRDMYRN